MIESRFIRLLLGFIAAVIMAVASVFVSHTASAAGEPTVGFASGIYIVRGSFAYLGGTWLTPGASYTLSTDGGAMTQNGDSQIDLVADDAGDVAATLYRTSTIPADDTSVHVVLSDGSGPVAQSDLDVRAPRIYIPNLCPARPNYLFGDGFADGDYTLSSPDVTFSPSTVHASGGSLEPVTPTGAAWLPAQYEVTATVAGTDFIAATSTEQRRVVGVSDRIASDPWHLHLILDCFAPNETVTVAPVDPRGTVTPSTMSTDDTGSVDITFALHPSRTSSPWGGADVVGQTSGQHSSAKTWWTGVYGTTLEAGDYLERPEGAGWDQFPVHLMLASAKQGYAFVSSCDPYVEWWPPDAGPKRVWRVIAHPELRPGPCRLTMQHNGNLVLRDATGKAIWETRTRGTGAQNRLVMRSDGNLMLRDGNGTLLWTRKRGRIAH